MEHHPTGLMRHLRSIIHRYRFAFLSVATTIIGVLLIVFAEKTAVAEHLRNFGVALLTAGTIGLASEFYTRLQFEALVTEALAEALDKSSLAGKLETIQGLLLLGTQVAALGLKKVYSARAEIDFAALLEGADRNTEIRLLGTCMMSLTNAPTQATLLRKLQDGCKIKLLILDAGSPSVQQRAVDERRAYENIRSDITSTDQLHRSFIEYRVSQPLRPNIELGHYDSAPAFFIVSTNRGMIVGFYLSGDRGDMFPHLELEVRGGGLYKPFLDHFDSLWATRREVAANTAPAPDR